RGDEQHMLVVAELRQTRAYQRSANEVERLTGVVGLHLRQRLLALRPGLGRKVDKRHFDVKLRMSYQRVARFRERRAQGFVPLYDDIERAAQRGFIHRARETNRETFIERTGFLVAKL